MAVTVTKQWHVHPVARARETREAAGRRKDEGLTDKMRDHNDVEWHFGGRGGIETSCSDKKRRTKNPSLISALVYLLCACGWGPCLHLAASQSEKTKQVEASAQLYVRQPGYRPIMSGCESNAVILLIFWSGRAECLSHTNGDVMNRYSGWVSL